MKRIGIVVIGRNEGERLRACLQSVAEWPTVYVDSNSTDGSVALARSLRVDVVELDAGRPLSAARARNAGINFLTTREPEIEFIQLVDGDCQMQPGWIEQARLQLESHDDVAVVCGRRRERFPEASIFNRLCDVEWNTPVGEALSCGGDAMMRVSALQEAKGFNETVVAGEEPELCARLRKSGWKIMRLHAEMTLHDAAMTRWGQWWKRQIRSGYGAMDAAIRFQVEEFGPQVRSVRIWTLGWGIATLVAAGCGLAAGGFWWGIFCLGAGVLMLILQMARITRWLARREPIGIAAIYAMMNMLGKWGQLWGQARYIRDKRQFGATRIIEYKAAGPARV